MAKLLNAARDLLVFMTRTKLPLIAMGAAVRRSEVPGVLGRPHHPQRLLRRVACLPHDDYFRWSYEFSCTANALAVKGRRPLPSCVGGGQAREMTLASVATGDDEGLSSPGPGAAGHEIDGLAEEFINWFREQLRMQHGTRASRGRVRGLTLGASCVNHGVIVH
jgi:hypothetical protein